MSCLPTRESRKAAVTLFWMQYSCTGSSGIPWSHRSTSTHFSAFFQCCYYSRQQLLDIRTEENQVKHGLPPTPSTFFPPVCTSPGPEFPWQSWQRTHRSTKQQQVVLIPRAQCRGLVSFALPMAHRSFPPGTQRTLGSARQSREEQVSHLLLGHHFVQVSAS